jgi:hypothetical protein
MSTTIQIKRSYTASAVPLAGDLAVGELAVNLADKRLFAKQADGTIIELSTNPTDLDAATLRIDGVEITASATELNSLDGLTATTAELNILDGVTATATEINVLDGFTGSTAELNLLDGVTATTAELNVLDGITATTTELNYTDGVTSSIQTQLNTKSPIASPTFTGTTTIPTVDINGGAIDGTVIGGTTPSTGAFTTGSFSGEIAADGGIALGDNDKATFGASDDLQIYHDGSDSYIDDAGQGSLAIRGGASVSLQNYAGGLMLKGNAGSDTLMYHNGSAKLATTSTGVDVTGNVTADGLTVDGDVDIKDTTLSNTSALLTLRDNRTTTDEENYVVAVTRQNSPTPAMYFGNNDLNEAVIAGNNTSILLGKDISGSFKRTLQVGGNGDVSFYEDTGTTAKFVWDASAESLGIGTSSPDAPLDVVAPTTNSVYASFSSTDTRPLQISSFNTASTDAGHDFNATSGNGELSFSTGSSERMRIDSSGNVGIGTASPGEKLHIDGGEVLVKSAYDQLGATDSKIYFATRQSGNWRNTFVGNSGENLVFGTGGTGLTHTNGTERARIDSSGNLLVGTTSSNAVASSSGGTTTGVETQPSGELQVGSNGDKCAIFNRQSSDGEIVRFRKDGSTIGSIGSIAGQYLSIGTGDTGLAFDDDENHIIPWNTTTNGSTNGSVDLGDGARRFKDLYLSGGVYLGGTGAANKLDDYEEGTFTPEIVGSTTEGSYSSTIKQGVYTKVGQTVHIAGYFLGSSGTGTGDLQINGLPFTVSSDAVGVIQANQGLVYPTGAVDACLYGSGGTSLQVRCNKADGSGYTKMAYPTTASYVRFTLTYRTAA